MSRSPIKDEPLRQAGQSLGEEINRILDDKVVPWALALSLSFVLCIWEWSFYLFPRPASLPWHITVMFFVVAGAALVKLARIRNELRNLRLGRKGELAVGQALDHLLVPMGYRVFHDLVAEGFNVDHVLVGPGGIFTCETKTISKPSGNETVTFDGETLLVAGRALDRDPIVQARAQADWVRTILSDSLDQQFYVRPVVLFPGWFVTSSGPNAHRDVWVLAPRALPAFLGNEGDRMSAKDVALAARALSLHVRAEQRARAAEK